MALNIRYQYLLLGVVLTKPKSIIEIGLAQGERAYQMIQLASKYEANIKYTGYDVFDTKSSSWHRMVGNGKQVASKDVIKSRLDKLTSNISLIEGMTSETLWLNPQKADYVWLDGDHRVEEIQRDFEAVKNSKIIVFDDFYVNGEHDGFTIDKFGCNKIVETFDKDQIFISPETKILPDIRIVFWSENRSIIKNLKYYLTDINNMKEYLSKNN